MRALILTLWVIGGALIAAVVILFWAFFAGIVAVILAYAFDAPLGDMSIGTWLLEHWVISVVSALLGFVLMVIYILVEGSK